MEKKILSDIIFTTTVDNPTVGLVNHLVQSCLHFNKCTDHLLDNLVTMQTLRQWVWSRAWGPAFLTNSQDCWCTDLAHS